MWNLQHIFFSYEDEYIGRLLNMHKRTLKAQSQVWDNFWQMKAL